MPCSGSGSCSSTRPRPSRAPSISCSGAASAPASARTSSAGSLGRSGRCSSTGRSSTRPPTSRSTGRRMLDLAAGEASGEQGPQWLQVNAPFRAYVLGELRGPRPAAVARSRGPLARVRGSRPAGRTTATSGRCSSSCGSAGRCRGRRPRRATSASGISRGASCPSTRPPSTPPRRSGFWPVAACARWGSCGRPRSRTDARRSGDRFRRDDGDGVASRWRACPASGSSHRGAARPRRSRAARRSCPRSTGSSTTARGCSSSSASSTSWRSTSRARSGAGATTCSRSSMATGSSRGSTRRPTAPPVCCDVPALHMEPDARPGDLEAVHAELEALAAVAGARRSRCSVDAAVSRRSPPDRRG